MVVGRRVVVGRLVVVRVVVASSRRAPLPRLLQASLAPPSRRLEPGRMRRPEGERQATSLT